MWIAPLIGIIDDGGDQAENPLGPYFKRRHFADLARGPSPETLQLFAEHWQMSPQTTQISQLLAEVYANALVRVGDRGRAIEVLQTATSNRRATITITPQWGTIGSRRGTPTHNCCVGSVATPRRSPSSATCCRC